MSNQNPSVYLRTEDPINPERKGMEEDYKKAAWYASMLAGKDPRK